MKTLLKKFPKLYNTAQRIYYSLFGALERIFGSTMQEWRWRMRHIVRGKQWARGYRHTLTHPHRIFLQERICQYQLLETILEVGCNAGPNLVLLTTQLPLTHFWGIDINTEAIKEGKKWMKEEGLQSAISLSPGKADDLSFFADKSMDCIFTDATLMYIGPDKIKKVAKEFLRVAKKVIVLFEYDNSQTDTEGYSVHGHWIYNYLALFQKLAPGLSIHRTPMPTNLWESPLWKKYGTLYEIRL